MNMLISPVRSGCLTPWKTTEELHGLGEGVSGSGDLQLGGAEGSVACRNNATAAIHSAINFSPPIATCDVIDPRLGSSNA